VQDGVELHPTFGWPPERLAYLIAGGEAGLVRSIEGAEDDGAAAVAADEGLALGDEDVMVAVAAWGQDRVHLRGAAARAAGALTINLADNPGTLVWRPRSRCCSRPAPRSSPARLG